MWWWMKLRQDAVFHKKYDHCIKLQSGAMIGVCFYEIVSTVDAYMCYNKI